MKPQSRPEAALRSVLSRRLDLPADPLAMGAFAPAVSTGAAVPGFDVVAFRASGLVVVDVLTRLNRMPRRCFHVSSNQLVSDL